MERSSFTAYAAEAKEILLAMREETQKQQPKPPRIRALAMSLASMAGGVTAVAAAGLKIAELVEKVRTLFP